MISVHYQPIKMNKQKTSFNKNIFFNPITIPIIFNLHPFCSILVLSYFCPFQKLFSFFSIFLLLLFSFLSSFLFLFLLSFFPSFFFSFLSFLFLLPLSSFFYLYATASFFFLRLSFSSFLLPFSCSVLFFFPFPLIICLPFFIPLSFSLILFLPFSFLPHISLPFYSFTFLIFLFLPPSPNRLLANLKFRMLYKRRSPGVNEPIRLVIEMDRITLDN